MGASSSATSGSYAGITDKAPSSTLSSAENKKLAARFNESTRALDLSHMGLRAMPRTLLQGASREFCEAVLRLTLAGNGLQVFPPLIPQLLPKLVVLQLQANSLKTLPDELALLAATLVELNVSENKLHELPRSICKLVQLRVLRLRGNQIATLPAEIGNLVHLNELDLAANLLVALPPQLGNVTSLEVLHLQHNTKLSSPPFSVLFDGTAAVLEWLRSHDNAAAVISAAAAQTTSGVSATSYSSLALSSSATSAPVSAPASTSVSLTSLPDKPTEAIAITRISSIPQSSTEKHQDFEIPGVLSTSPSSSSNAMSPTSPRNCNIDTTPLNSANDFSVTSPPSSSSSSKDNEGRTRGGSFREALNNSFKTAFLSSSPSKSNYSSNDTNSVGGPGPSKNYARLESDVSDLINAGSMLQHLREEKKTVSGLEAMVLSDLKELQDRERLQMVMEMRSREEEQFRLHQLDLEQKKMDELARLESKREMDSQRMRDHMEAASLRNQRDWELRRAAEDLQREKEELERESILRAQLESKLNAVRLENEMRERKNLEHLLRLQREAERAEMVYVASEDSRSRESDQRSNIINQTHEIQQLIVSMNDRELEQRRQFAHARSAAQRDQAETAFIQRDEQRKQLVEHMSSEQRKVLDAADHLIAVRLAEEAKWLESIRHREIQEKERLYWKDVYQEHQQMENKWALKVIEANQENGRFLDEMAADAKKKEFNRLREESMRKLEEEKDISRLAWLSEYNRILRARPKWMREEDSYALLLAELSVSNVDSNSMPSSPPTCGPASTCRLLQSSEDDNDATEENTERSPNRSECVVCLDKSINTVLIECGHACACQDCAAKLTLCPICRSDIARVIKIFVE